MGKLLEDFKKFLATASPEELDRAWKEVEQFKDVCLKCEYREMELNGNKCYCVVLHWGSGLCMKVLQYLKKEE